MTTVRKPLGHADLGDRHPLWLIALAVLAVLYLATPIAVLIARVPWPSVPELVVSPAALSALSLSLGTAALATLLCVALGVPLGIVFANTNARGMAALRTIVLLPLVLPPVVSGIALLTAFGRRGPVGMIAEQFGISIGFSTGAVVMAQLFVALPFLVLSVEGALRSRTRGYEQVAATLGASRTQTLLRVTLPLAAPAIIAGTVLAFARALGEFGATLTFAGSLEGVTRTLPLEIYLQREIEPDAALALACILIAVAFVIVALVYARGGARFARTALLGEDRGRV